MAERFRQFLPRTEPWHSFGNAAAAALAVGLSGLLGAPWWALALAAAALTALVFRGAPERHRHRIIGIATVAGALAPLPAVVVAGSGTALLVWALAAGLAVGIAGAVARLAVHRAYLAAGLLETILTVEAFALAAGVTQSSLGGTWPPLIARLAAAVAVFLIHYERFHARRGTAPTVAGRAGRAAAAAGTVALVAFQGSFIAGFLPFSVVQQALLVALGLVLVREAVSLSMFGELTRTNVVQGVLAGVLGAFVLFSAVSWSI